MSNINNYFGKQIQSNNNRDNLFPVFLSIKKRTDAILRRYEDKNFLKDPSVNAGTIAYDEGIKEIYPASPEEVNNEHSYLENGIIYLNVDNDPEEWLFSTAHETAHFLNSEKTPLMCPIYRTEANPKLEILEKTLSTLSILIIIGSCSNGIAETVSRKIGKPVSDKNIIIILKKMANECYSKNESETVAERMTKFSITKRIEKIPDSFMEKIIKSIPEIIKNIYDEEIADYFAANLLVPTERFLLWEDKSDEEIAQAFRVTFECIQKRRKEIKDELYFISFPEEHTLSRELKIARGNVVGIGKVKIPSIPMLFDYNIKWLSFLDIQKSENYFISTCINLRVDGYGETKEEAESDMFESIIYFLYQNFSNLSFNDAWENIYDLYKSDDWSKELWDVYHEAQIQLINKIELKTELENLEYQANERETDGGLADMIRKIMNGLLVHKTYFKVTA
jgi:Zn-dependent peptidase ImmA (M78 family)